ncbi:uncharacterized protein VTP21DRAFT_5049 [Calcarisporiella thermophila]|uniref:uncharacterized protein n=1 Tax=Calcarisporiella thermophila TaxID=911321 RepID=UPI003742D665
MSKIDYSLYLVTDSGLLPPGRDLPTTVAQAIEGGVTLVQLREKNLDTAHFVDIAKRVQQECRKQNVPLLINDRLDVAQAIDADGVHIGQDDMPLKEVRRLFPGKVVGISVHDVEEAQRAIQDGADYISIGAVYDTATKSLTRTPLGIKGLRELLTSLKSSPIPVVTIGGIKHHNVERILRKSATPSLQLSGVAVVSDIIAASDPTHASRQLIEKISPYTRPSLSALPPAVRSTTTREIVEKVAQRLADIRKKTPMVQQITNFVTMNELANATLAIGASPIMAHCKKEHEELARINKALVVNLGTLTEDWVESMIWAAQVSNNHKIPVVCDPVGAGATELRRSTCNRLLEQAYIDIIKGNYGEIATLAGEAVKMRGVDSIGEAKDPASIVSRLAKIEHNVIAMSGKVDFVSDGERTFSIANGHEYLAHITGSGCMATSLIACFAGVEEEKDYLISAIGGLLFLGIASEHAAKRADVKGPGTFRAALFDEMYNLTPEDILSEAKLESI